MTVTNDYVSVSIGTEKENDDLSILANKMKILVLTNQLNRHELKKIYQYLWMYIEIFFLKMDQLL